MAMRYNINLNVSIQYPPRNKFNLMPLLIYVCRSDACVSHLVERSPTVPYGLFVCAHQKTHLL